MIRICARCDSCACDNCYGVDSCIRCGKQETLLISREELREILSGYNNELEAVKARVKELEAAWLQHALVLQYAHDTGEEVR